LQIPIEVNAQSVKKDRVVHKVSNWKLGNFLIISFLVSVLSITNSASPAFGDSTYIPCGPNGETYEVSNGHDLADGKNCLGIVVIPPFIDSISDSAFMDSKITSVVMPDSVKFLGVNVFLGSTLTSIKLSNSLKEIRKSTFERSSLREITIPNSVTIIGEYAFFGSKIESINLGNSVRYIGTKAFASARYLKSISIPDTFVSQGTNIFFSNPALERIEYCGPLYNPDDSAPFPRQPICPSKELEFRKKQLLEAKAAEAAIAASLKKTKITCVKGKLIKKVTAVKPKCPTGYKIRK
jgi:hypothetical protein